MPTRYEKFKLLVWKDWLLQWNHKLSLAIEILLPILFTLLLVWIRTLIKPDKLGVTVYKQHFSLDNIVYTRSCIVYKLKHGLTEPDFTSEPDNRVREKEFQWHIAYSPRNEVFEKLVAAVAGVLKLTYTAHANSKALEKKLKTENIFVGVEFPDKQARITKLPRHLDFKLRFPSELRTTFGSYIYSWMTNILFFDDDPLGPRNRRYADGGTVHYYREGFVSVQHCISKEFITQSAEKATTIPPAYIRRYPYPEVIDDPLLASIGSMMVLIVLLSYIYPVTFTVKSITAEKEKQLKEVMIIMGLDSWIHWAAWFARSFLMMSISTFVMLTVLMIKWRRDVAVLTFSSFTACYFFFMMYVVNTIFFCFMLATMFSKASTAGAVTGLIWFVSYLPYIFIERNYDELSAAAKLTLGLSSNTAMGLGVRLIQTKELEGIGLQWDNMFVQTSPDENITMGSLFGVMILSSIIYMLICLYMEQVFPGEYGIAKPWNFPFKKAYWVDTPEKVAIKARRGTIKLQRHDSDEEIPNQEVGIEIRNLYKVFGDKTVVNNLSLNMYQNEITVLLGHNGAGKTTTITILTGMLKPTAGTAIVNGFDIKKDMEGARMSLGICPQHNVLFDDLTVENHLVFFSRLKGLKGEELQEEVETFIAKTGLEKKANLISSKLSGGMKRRLSLCTAFCGGTKVVLCDEPSSGLDPAARRKLWEFIQSEKRGRTILLTTHFMDEAEVLGDHIAIMRAGEVQAYGTAFSLKKKYGEGYKLICIKEEGCRTQEVTQLLAKYIPEIKPTSNVGVELVYTMSEDHSPKFGKMLEDLDKNSAKLHLGGYGISLTTLEDVFLKVGADKLDQKIRSSRKSVVEHAYDDWIYEEHFLKSGRALRKSQWKAMFYKKRIYTMNNKMLFLIQNLIPVIFVVSTILAVKLTVYGGLVPRKLTLEDYPHTVTGLEVTSSVQPNTMLYNMAIYYRKYVKSLGHGHKIEDIHEDIQSHILKQGRKQQFYVDRRYIVAATIRDNSITAWYNNEPLHSAPVAVNLIDNALARAVLGPDVFITVTNKPLSYGTRKQLQNLDSMNSEGTQIALNMSFAMAFISAFYVIFLVAEYQSRAKLLQFVAGVNVYTFWLTHFLWDMATYCLTALIGLISLIASREPGYSTITDMSRYLIIMVCFGISFLWFVYWLAYMFDEPAVAFSRLTVFFFFTGNACMLVVLVLGYKELNSKDKADLLRAWLFVFPHFSMAIAFVDVYKNTRLHSLCKPFMSLNDQLRCRVFPHCCKLVSYYGWKEPGLLKPIFFLLLTAIIFATIVILREYKVFENIWLKYKSRYVKAPPPLTHTYYDEDVEEEKERVKNMTQEEREMNNLVVDRLKKNFGPFIAVNGISFAVQRQQCFGLLGVNGAGKTCTFKMLTGDDNMSGGEAYVQGISMRKDMHVVYQRIGYCPQFDALFDYFTAQDMLVMFALIRGIDETELDDMVENLAVALGLTHHYYRQTITYSGGNKRKLSVALAIIGNPAVIYLDEPTTGMDPAARRRFWDAICRIRDSGKSIILTTHSMEECEALCTRIAIMVNGEIKCIGSMQHLKNKFSQGLILKIQFGAESERKRRSSRSTEGRRATLEQLEDSDVRKFTEFIKQSFPRTYLQDRYRRLVTYYIVVDEIPWSQLFDMIEKNKENLNIEDYTISQTSLEEIFLQIAMYQYDDPREARMKEFQKRPSVFKKMMSSTSLARVK